MLKYEARRVELKFIALAVFQLCIFIKFVQGHGRLLEPPARNTLWRFGFKAPANYNDNELFCGGIGGIARNGGKCGICGDPYDGVRRHETGNELALNETARNYFPGSSVDLMVEIVANHGGKFNFEICWRNEWETRESEECFEKLPLSGSVGQDQQFDYALEPKRGTGVFTLSVDLPANRTCEKCILRWHWKSANNWGVCEDGTERVGCGYQEIYRNCADISVTRTGAGIGLGIVSSRRRRRIRDTFTSSANELY